MSLKVIAHSNPSRHNQPDCHHHLERNIRSHPEQLPNLCSFPLLLNGLQMVSNHTATDSSRPPHPINPTLPLRISRNQVPFAPSFHCLHRLMTGPDREHLKPPTGEQVLDNSP